MPLTKRVKDAFLFPNGNLAVCDAAGEQICELQGMYSIDKHKRILLERLDNCVLHGFEALPEGFYRTANEWAIYFRLKNLSWEEIQEL